MAREARSAFGMHSLDSTVRTQDCDVIPRLPSWVSDFVEYDHEEWEPINHGMRVRACYDAHFSLISICQVDALRLDAESFADMVYGAYEQIARRLERSAEWHPVRVWNFIPQILDPLGAHRQRYMVFNAARYRAYENWYGSFDQFPKFLATASGVGHCGRDLVIHCLAASHQGVAVENPRQISSYLYSSRYGTRPPCFSRASQVFHAGRSQSWLMVGGTASIVGEDSRHAECIHRQLDETFQNLSSLMTTAIRAERKGSGNTSHNGESPMRHFRHLRVYHTRSSDRELIMREVQARMTQSDTIECLQAQLCRPELLLEIEGLARLNDCPLNLENELSIANRS